MTQEFSPRLLRLLVVETPLIRREYGWGPGATPRAPGVVNAAGAC